jgi:hypothetical protein
MAIGRYAFMTRDSVTAMRFADYLYELSLSDFKFETYNYWPHYPWCIGFRFTYFSDRKITLPPVADSYGHGDGI